MQQRIKRIGSLTLLFTLSTAALTAADWPQYRGPNQDGISPEKIQVKWPAAGPQQIWKTPTPTGFSSFAVASGRAATQVVRELEGVPREVVLCLDANSGKELWIVNIGVGKFQRGGDSGAPDNNGGDGPRSTPVIDGERVYAYTQDLVLYCLEAATGKVVWEKDVMKEHAGRNIGWKSAMSPVIDGDSVFVGGGGAGQSLLAFNKNSGAVVWRAHDETITHSTPVVATILGTRQVIYFLKSGLLSVAAKDGAELWRFPFRFNVSTAISPVICDDVVYCSAGYGVGGGACKITREGDRFVATEMWKIGGDTKVANHWSTPVYLDGHLYGMFSFKAYGRGPLKCVEVKTGEVKWEEGGFGAGNVILADRHLVALTDDGQVVIVEATPSAYKELARAKVLTGKCWTTPALSGGRLYVRSTQEGACVDVSVKTAAGR